MARNTTTKKRKWCGGCGKRRLKRKFYRQGFDRDGVQRYLNVCRDCKRAGRKSTLKPPAPADNRPMCECGMGKQMLTRVHGEGLREWCERCDYLDGSSGFEQAVIARLRGFGGSATPRDLLADVSPTSSECRGRYRALTKMILHGRVRRVADGDDSYGFGQQQHRYELITNGVAT